MNDQDNAFKPIIEASVITYNATSNTMAKLKIKESLKETIKKWTDQPVNMVSVAVMQECEKRGINPFELLWPKRNIIGKDENGKSLLLWEHTTPIGELFDQFIKCKSGDEIENVMSSYSGVCWIMRHEDNALNKSKYRSKRPGGWKSCYESCGIEVIVK